MLESGEGLLLFFGCWLEGFHKLRPSFGSNGAAATEEPPPKALPSQLGKGRKNRTFQSFCTRQKEERERKGWEGRKEEKRALVFFLNFLSLFRLREKSFFPLFFFAAAVFFRDNQFFSL